MCADKNYKQFIVKIKLKKKTKEKQTYLKGINFREDYILRVSQVFPKIREN